MISPPIITKTPVDLFALISSVNTKRHAVYVKLGKLEARFLKMEALTNELPIHLSLYSRLASIAENGLPFLRDGVEKDKSTLELRRIQLKHAQLNNKRHTHNPQEMALRQIEINRLKSDLMYYDQLMEELNQRVSEQTETISTFEVVINETNKPLSSVPEKLVVTEHTTNTETSDSHQQNINDVVLGTELKRPQPMPSGDQVNSDEVVNEVLSSNTSENTNTTPISAETIESIPSEISNNTNLNDTTIAASENQEVAEVEQSAVEFMNSDYSADSVDGISAEIESSQSPENFNDEISKSELNSKVNNQNSGADKDIRVRLVWTEQNFDELGKSA